MNSACAWPDNPLPINFGLWKYLMKKIWIIELFFAKPALEIDNSLIYLCFIVQCKDKFHDDQGWILFYSKQ